MATTIYSFANVNATLDGQRLKGFWEGDDAITTTQNSDAGNPVVGVDGVAVVSRGVDGSVTITYKVIPGSQAQRMFESKMRSINAGDDNLFPVSVSNIGNGEGGSSVEATIIKEPDQTEGENASEREWTVFANDWTPNETTYTT